MSRRKICSKLIQPEIEIKINFLLTKCKHKKMIIKSACILYQYSNFKQNDDNQYQFVCNGYSVHGSQYPPTSAQLYISFSQSISCSDISNKDTYIFYWFTNCNSLYFT